MGWLNLGTTDPGQSGTTQTPLWPGNQSGEGVNLDAQQSMTSDDAYSYNQPFDYDAIPHSNATTPYVSRPLPEDTVSAAKTISMQMAAGLVVGVLAGTIVVSGMLMKSKSLGFKSNMNRNSLAVRSSAVAGAIAVPVYLYAMNR